MTKQINQVVYLATFLIIIFSGIGIVITMAQMNNEKEKNKNAEIKTSIFGQANTTKESCKSCRVAEIRRVTETQERYRKERGAFTEKKELVEIELVSDYFIPVTNFGNHVQIGDNAFVLFIGGIIIMKKEEFDELKDGALIVLSIGPAPTQEMMKEFYKNGEPEKIHGAKFGRLDKSMIDKSPAITEDYRDKWKRLSKIKDKPE